MIVRVGTLEIDESHGRATFGGRDLSLRPLDLRVLACMARSVDRALTRSALAIELWGEDSEVDERSVDASVTRLRKALADEADAIVTIRRVGYRLDPSRLGIDT